jgi:hypothetical protein
VFFHGSSSFYKQECPEAFAPMRIERTKGALSPAL